MRRFSLAILGALALAALALFLLSPKPRPALETTPEEATASPTPSLETGPIPDGSRLRLYYRVLERDLMPDEQLPAGVLPLEIDVRFINEAGRSMKQFAYSLHFERALGAVYPNGQITVYGPITLAGVNGPEGANGVLNPIGVNADLNTIRQSLLGAADFYTLAIKTNWDGGSRDFVLTPQTARWESGTITYGDEGTVSYVDEKTLTDARIQTWLQKQ